MASQQYPGNFFSSLGQWPNPDGDGDEIDDSQDTQLPISVSSEACLLGFFIANVVGLQYYTGRISGRELVGLVREPLNPYDENAIKVLNTRTHQVGHVERSAAKVLAPLIDQNLISVEGIVPKVAGARNRFRIPVQIHIFTHQETFGRIKSAISRGGFQLISNDDVSFTLSEAAVVKEKKAKEDGKSVDEIFNMVDESVSKKMAKKAMEPPKDIIKSELFLHQKEGLWWLTQRENLEELPPFWEERNGAYVNVLTNYQTDTRPEPLRGGIFADDMGLGKTLTLLSLIALDKCGSVTPSSIDTGGVVTQQNEESNEDGYSFVESGSKKGKRGRPSKNASNSLKRRKYQDTSSHKMEKGKALGGLVKCGDVPSAKSTLIVCPPSVFSTWVTQLGEHTIPGKLKTYMYYGERTQDVEQLQKYDIVLTTYSTLATEDSSPVSPMKKIQWWRIILDEAHIIKNANAQQSRAVSNLNAKRRWVVTGTPIQNGSMDLFSLMAFLRFEPFSIKSYWNSLVQRLLAQGSEKGLSRLQVLMAAISLRRTKDKDLAGLPSKSIETCFVELSAEERELYDRLETEGKNLVRDFISAGSLTSHYTTVLSIILRLRQICTDLALCPSDLKSLLPSNNIEDVSNNPELLKKLVELLQDGEDMDCPICLSPPNDIVITCCAHVFCRSCILKTLKQTKPRCPLCRHPLTESDLFSSPPPESSETGDTSLSSSSTSSKVSALIQLLSLSRDENPNRKSIVFSQFRKMLILLEKPLKAAGFKFLRLDGSMNARKRSQVIQEFGCVGPDSPTILLASLKASGTGINLTAASRVYLLEPWWNPAVEEQAMDRVHRIGQKEEVKIVRMIARNSIEERVLELQEKKKKLARQAFCRKGPKGRNAVNAGDLQTLMSL